MITAGQFVRVGDGYAATLIVSGYPAEVGMAWLEPLLAWAGRSDVALHIDPLPTDLAAGGWRRQRDRLESSRRIDADRGRLDDPLIVDCPEPWWKAQALDARFSQYESPAASLAGGLSQPVQGEVLARVLLSDQSVTIADLARQLGAPLPTVAREVKRLKDAGILTVVRHGRGQLVSGNDADPAFGPLRDLVAVVFGPRYVIAEEFTDLADLEELIIFGSWAARYRGERGNGGRFPVTSMSSSSERSIETTSTRPPTGQPGDLPAR